MKTMLKVLWVCLLILMLLYVWGDMRRYDDRKEHEAGVLACRTQWKACLAKTKTDKQADRCSADLDLCLRNLP